MSLRFHPQHLWRWKYFFCLLKIPRDIFPCHFKWIQVKINLTLIAVDFLLISPRMSIISFLFCTTRHIFANFHLHLRHSGWPRMWLVDGTRLCVKYAATFYVSLPWKINKMRRKKVWCFIEKLFHCLFFLCLSSWVFVLWGGLDVLLLLLMF